MRQEAFSVSCRTWLEAALGDPSSEVGDRTKTKNTAQLKGHQVRLVQGPAPGAWSPAGSKSPLNLKSENVCPVFHLDFHVGCQSGLPNQQLETRLTIKKNTPHRSRAIIGKKPSWMRNNFISKCVIQPSVLVISSLASVVLLMLIVDVNHLRHNEHQQYNGSQRRDRQRSAMEHFPLVSVQVPVCKVFFWILFWCIDSVAGGGDQGVAFWVKSFMWFWASFYLILLLLVCISPFRWRNSQGSKVIDHIIRV